MVIKYLKLFLREGYVSCQKLLFMWFLILVQIDGDASDIRYVLSLAPCKKKLMNPEVRIIEHGFSGYRSLRHLSFESRTKMQKDIEKNPKIIHNINQLFWGHLVFSGALSVSSWLEIIVEIFLNVWDRSKFKWDTEQLENRK